MAQLQSQLTQFKSDDTILKARQQHGATVWSLLERHKGLMVSMRVQVDYAKTRASRLEQEKAVLSIKLGRRWLNLTSSPSVGVIIFRFFLLQLAEI